jgi:hypothetical protein
MHDLQKMGSQKVVDTRSERQTEKNTSEGVLLSAADVHERE